MVASMSGEGVGVVPYWWLGPRPIAAFSLVSKILSAKEKWRLIVFLAALRFALVSYSVVQFH